MNCLHCGAPLDNTYVCPDCGTVSQTARKIIFSSNWHYNQALERTKIRDLSGACASLEQALKYNKKNTHARNLLGLIYYHEGEIVSALGQWVISVHFQQTDNPAARYIRTIQDNPSMLREADHIIRRYNAALEDIHEGNEDLAILELKKVVNLSPTYIRAYQLLGLLYIRRKQYAAARRALMKAVKVDRNNITTLSYLRYVNDIYKKAGKSKASVTDVRISDPNPIVVEQKTDQGYSGYNTGFISFINIIIGIIIGAAVIWLLLVPSVTKAKEAEYNQAVVEYSAQISDRNKQIDSLNKQVEELDSSLSKYKNEVGDAVSDNGTSSDNLKNAAASYLEGDLEAAGMTLAEIDPNAITDEKEKVIYQKIRQGAAEEVSETLYANAQDSYDSGDYVSAIDGYKKTLRMDEEDTRAMYYMGRSYQMVNDYVNAASWYQKLIKEYPDSDYAPSAQNYLEQIQNEAGSDVVKAAETETGAVSQTEAGSQESQAGSDSENGGQAAAEEE